MSLLLGFVAFATAAGFACFIPGLNIERAFESPVLIENAWAPLLFALAAFLFQFGIPFFCLASFFFGMRAKRQWTARTGMILSIISLLGYGYHIYFFIQFVNA